MEGAAGGVANPYLAARHTWNERYLSLRTALARITRRRKRHVDAWACSPDRAG